MGMLTKNEILAKQDLKIEKLEIKEWGGFVYIRTMTSEERDEWEMQVLAMDKGKTPPKLRARLSAQLICDENGNSIFTQNDVEALSKKNASALNRVFERVMALNLLSNDDIEELSKN